MEESIKEKRHKEIHQFIIKSLRDRPLSASQLLEKIRSKKNNQGKPFFRVSTLVSLKKDHLIFLQKKFLVFRLDKKDFLIEGNKKIESEEFMRKFWFEWERGGKRNYYHSYYFYTPRTSKIYSVFVNIMKKFQEYFNDKDENKILKNINNLTWLLINYELFSNVKNSENLWSVNVEDDLKTLKEIIKKGKLYVPSQEEKEVVKDYEGLEDLIFNSLLGYVDINLNKTSTILISLYWNIKRILGDTLILLSKNLNLKEIITKEANILNKNSHE